MYEKVRTELTGRLAARFEAKDVRSILSIIDGVMIDYDITRRETAIQLYDNSLQDAMRIYLLCKKAAGFTEGSIQNIMYTLRKFAGMIGKPLKDITTNDIRAYLLAYQRQNCTSQAYMNKIRERLNGFFEWCADEGYVGTNPVRRVAKIKAPKANRRALREDELEYCRNQCQTLREKALLEVLFSTGARVREVSNLDIRDIDWTTNSAKVFGKNSEYYTVYLNAKARVALKFYLNSRHDDCPALFVTQRRPISRLMPRCIQQTLKEIGKRAELNIVLSPHIMRHTMATLAFQHGASLETVQHMLNHKSPATTQIYAEMDKTAVAAAHRRAVV